MTRGLNSGHIGMDTDPEAEHWAGSIPLARAVGGMARGGSRRVSLSGSARPVPTGTGHGPPHALQRATRRVFGKFLLIGLIYSMILNNPPERVFKREK